MDINFWNEIDTQVNECYKKYGAYASRHEFLGVLLEEVFELEKELFKKDKELDFLRVKEELIDVATVIHKGYEDIINNGIDRIRNGCTRDK